MNFYERFKEVLSSRNDDRHDRSATNNYQELIVFWLYLTPPKLILHIMKTHSRINDKNQQEVQLIIN